MQMGQEEEKGRSREPQKQNGGRKLWDWRETREGPTYWGCRGRSCPSHPHRKNQSPVSGPSAHRVREWAQVDPRLPNPKARNLFQGKQASLTTLELLSNNFLKIFTCQLNKSFKEVWGRGLGILFTQISMSSQKESFFLYQELTKRYWLFFKMKVHRILEWVAYPFSSRSSPPRNLTRVSCIAGGFFTNWASLTIWGIVF